MSIKRFFKRTFIILLGAYILGVGLFYFYQEKLIFHPEKLDTNYAFRYGENVEEMWIETQDKKLLNGLLFKTENANGLIFYLHGNAGSLKKWGNVARTYNQLNYDVFIIDYRGYGKSEGNITNQNQLFDDNQMAYNALKKKYKEENIIVLGYSIGTGLAAKLASENNPKLLILQAPYYSLTDLMKHYTVIVPTFFLRYKLETHAYLKKCDMPVIIFHGDIDRVIYYGSAQKLEKEFEDKVQLITLKGQSHNGITENPEYQIEIQKLLEE